MRITDKRVRKKQLRVAMKIINSMIFPLATIRDEYPRVESHSSTCVVRSGGEVPTLEVSPLFFSRSLLLLLPLLPLLLSSSSGFYSFSLSSLLASLFHPFWASFRLTSSHPARTTRVVPSSLLCVPSPFFSSPSSLRDCLSSSRVRASARARTGTSLYTGARHESTLGSLAVSSSDSSRRICCPLWSSHWLGLLPARL